MLRISALVLIATLAANAAASVSAERPGTMKLAAQCRQEAMQGHFRAGRFLPVSGPELDAHRNRMAALCLSWLDAGAATAQELLEQCLAEADRGPHVLHNGRDLDRNHVARLKNYCRALATEAGK